MKSKLLSATSSILALTAVYATIVSFSWGIDFHHDGYNFFPIFAMSQNQSAFEDFLIFKGPLYPFIISQLSIGQSISIFQVRLFNSMLALIIALMIKLICDKSRFQKCSLVVAILWLATNPAWSFLPNSSWPGDNLIDPNYLSTAIMLGSAYCFIIAYNKSKFFMALSGLLMGLAPWVQQKGLLFPVFFVFFSLLAHFWGKKDRELILTWFLSFFISLIAPIIWLIENKIFDLWVDQTFIDVFKLMSSDSVVTSMGLFDIMVRSAVFLLMTIVCVIFSFTVLFICKFKVNLVRALFYSILVLVFSLAPFLGIIGKIDQSKNLDFNNWIILISSWLPNMVWYASFCGFTVIGGVFVYEKIKHFFRKIQSRDNPKFFSAMTPTEAFFLSMGLSALLFLYPSFGYFWWFAPISFLSCVLLIESPSIKFQPVVHLFERVVQVSVLIPVVVAGLTLFIVAEAQPKFPYSDSKLVHMVEFSKNELEIKEAEIKFMNNIKSGHLRMNDCLDVFLLTHLPKSVTLDRYYGPLPIRQFTAEKNDFKSDYIVTCSPQVIVSTYLNMGYKEIARDVLSDGRSIILWKNKLEKGS
jgi:hypothetical protein